MGKISPVSAKYIIHAIISIEGVVDRPDVIGAIFGQTEGLLGADLELRSLQRSGRIGRIEVDVDTKSGKTQGAIIVPSSLDKAETAIVGASLEIIQRIGPCNAKVNVEKIEDVRVSKRSFVIERAKALLKDLMDKEMPDSQELADEVTYSVRVMEIKEYGKDRLAAGPAIADSDEIYVVEGRADVLTLLKNGIKNAIALNGTSVPQTIIELSKQKTITVFVDGDRGGDLIIKEIVNVADIDFVTKAPDGKEVEELTKKEIHKALRSRIAVEQAKMEIKETLDRQEFKKPFRQRQENEFKQPIRPSFIKKQFQKQLSSDEKKKFKSMLESLIGTRGAYILDEKLNILGKVPLSELATTVKNLNTKVYAVILDGSIDRDLINTLEIANTNYIIGMNARSRSNKLSVLTLNDL